MKNFRIIIKFCKINSNSYLINIENLYKLLNNSVKKLHNQKEKKIEEKKNQQVCKTKILIKLKTNKFLKNYQLTNLLTKSLLKNNYCFL